MKKLKILSRPLIRKSKLTFDQSKKMSEEDDNDPINSINYSVEKFEEDKVIKKLRTD